MGTRSSVQANLISQFRIATGVSYEDAYCYLEAANWNISAAFEDWRNDYCKAS